MGLRGKTVLVTRASGQNQGLTQALEQLEARVICIPTIEIVAPKSWHPVDAAIQHLGDYDWVVFASRNAVDRFTTRAAGRMESFRGKIAAVGSRTAGRLTERGLRADLVPDDFSAEGLLKVFPADLHGVRILLPRGETGNDRLPKELSSRGAHLTSVAVYRNALPRYDGSKLRNLLETGVLDCIVFTSGSTVRNLLRMLNTPNTVELLRSPAIAVIGPSTRDAAVEAGLHVDIEPDCQTILDLLEAIRRHFQERR